MLFETEAFPVINLIKKNNTYWAFKTLALPRHVLQTQVISGYSDRPKTFLILNFISLFTT